MRTGLVGLSALLLTCLPRLGARAEDNPPWKAYETVFEGAKYIDPTHAFHPKQPIWPGFAPPVFGAGTGRG